MALADDLDAPGPRAELAAALLDLRQEAVGLPSIDRALGKEEAMELPQRREPPGVVGHRGLGHRTGGDDLDGPALVAAERVAQGVADRPNVQCGRYDPVVRDAELHA